MLKSIASNADQIPPSPKGGRARGGGEHGPRRAPTLNHNPIAAARLRAAVGFALLTAIGCGKQQQLPTPQASAPPVVAKLDDPAPFPVVPDPPEQLVAVAPPARKLAVFTPSGLLYLDLAITIDGEPLQRGVSALADRLVASADADADGLTAWDELIENRRFLSGPLANSALRTSRADRRRWRELYDVDGDGRVDRREALAWMQRDENSGRVGLTLLGGRAYTPSLVASATWRTLDADRSGSLSDDEIATAPARLLSRDVNDDRVLAPSELLSLADLARLRLEGNPLAGGMASSSYNDAAFRSALLVDRDADTRDVQSTLASFGGSPNDPRQFGFAERLAAAIDGDGNGYLAKGEWPALRAADAHARIEAPFGAGGEDDSLRLEGVAPERRLTIEADPRDAARFQITIAPRAGDDPGGVLLVAAVDEAGAADPGAQVDEALERLDNDGDGALNADELEAGGPRVGGFSAESLRQYDTDGDAVASREEIVAYLRDLTARDRLSVSIVVNDATDPHFATLDFDGDGRLGEREIDRAGETLRAATVGDGARPDATPWRMRLTVYRTRRQINGMEPPPAPRSRRDAVDAPAWFVGADANRDGELSRREFIGDDSEFAAYDADGDGYVTVVEVGGAID